VAATWKPPIEGDTVSCTWRCPIGNEAISFMKSGGYSDLVCQNWCKLDKPTTLIFVGESDQTLGLVDGEISESDHLVSTHLA